MALPKTTSSRRLPARSLERAWLPGSSSAFRHEPARRSRGARVRDQPFQPRAHFRERLLEPPVSRQPEEPPVRDHGHCAPVMLGKMSPRCRSITSCFPSMEFTSRPRASQVVTSTVKRLNSSRRRRFRPIELFAPSGAGGVRRRFEGWHRTPEMAVREASMASRRSGLQASPRPRPRRRRRAPRCTGLRSAQAPQRLGPRANARSAIARSANTTRAEARYHPPRSPYLAAQPSSTAWNLFMSMSKKLPRNGRPAGPGRSTTRRSEPGAADRAPGAPAASVTQIDPPSSRTAKAPAALRAGLAPAGAHVETPAVVPANEHSMIELPFGQKGASVGAAALVGSQAGRGPEQYELGTVRREAIGALGDDISARGHRVHQARFLLVLSSWTDQARLFPGSIARKTLRWAHCSRGATREPSALPGPQVTEFGPLRPEGARPARGEACYRRGMHRPGVPGERPLLDRSGMDAPSRASSMSSVICLKLV